MPEKKSHWAKAIPRKGSQLLIPYAIILVFLIFLPVVFIAIFSFTVSDLPPGSNASFFQSIEFTFANFVTFFTQSGIVSSLVLSLLLGLATGISSIFIAYPIAFILHSTKGFKKTNFIILVTMPLWLNVLVQTYAIRTLLSVVGAELNQDILGTNFALWTGMIYLYLPFMILPIYNQLSGIDKNLVEASRDLGANSFKTFFKILLPLSIPGVLSGFTIVFLTATTSLAVPQILGGGNIFLIANLIQNEFVNGSNYGLGSAMAVIIAIVVSLVTGLLGLSSWWFSRQKSLKKEKKVNTVYAG